ncbi:MAG: hypothetical protein AAGB26_12275 [Planctomycetota bacterium]
MSELPLILSIVKDPALLVTLAPIGLIFLGVVTFEIAMAITISTLPRSRVKQKWTVEEQRRLVRVFLSVFSVWPITVGVIAAHVFLPLLIALFADLMILGLIVLGLRWIKRGMRDRRLALSGHCMDCYYDLRGSLDRDECPECGTPIHEHPLYIAASRQRAATVEAEQAATR